MCTKGAFRGRIELGHGTEYSPQHGSDVKEEWSCIMDKIILKILDIPLGQ